MSDSYREENETRLLSSLKHEKDTVPAVTTSSTSLNNTSPADSAPGLRYLFVVSDGELVWGTSDYSVVVVGVLPTTVPLEEQRGTDVGEVEDLTFIVLGRCVDDQLERAL